MTLGRYFNLELLEIQDLGLFTIHMDSSPFIFSQEITQGVRSSTRAVRLAEERLRRLTNMKTIGYYIIN